MSAGASPALAKLPVPTKFAYGLGTLAFGIKDQGFSALLMLYYNQVVGLPAAWVGAAIIIAMCVDVMVDPLIGHYSDHLHTRWGRRHPFMYASALPAAIAYALLWSPPETTHVIQFAYLLATSVCVRIAIACYEIPSSALMTEFTHDYDERTSLSTYRSLFLAIGTVGMAVLAFKVFLRPTAAQPVGQLNASGYELYGVVAAAVILLSILLSSWGTHHRIPTLRVDDAERPGMDGLWRQLKTLLADRTYASVLLCAFFFAIGGGVATTLNLYINTYFWRLSTDQIAVLAGSMGWGVILGLAVVQLSKRFGKKQIAMTLYSTALLVVTLPVAAGLTGIMPTHMSVLMPILIAQAVLMATCILAALILATSMIADVGEHFELKSGKRMEGLMFAALIMINKAVSGGGVFLSGIALSSVGFPEKADPATIDPLAVMHLGWIYVIGVGGLCALAIAALSFYPITRATHERVLRELGKA